MDPIQAPFEVVSEQLADRRDKNYRPLEDVKDEDIKIIKIWHPHELGFLIHHEPMMEYEPECRRTLSLDQLREKYQSYNTEWKDNCFDKDVRNLFEKDHDLFKDLGVSQCVCIGIGQFAEQCLIAKHDNKELPTMFKASPQPTIDSKGTYYKISKTLLNQLILFHTIVQLLKKKHRIEKVLIQEPDITGRVEERFIKDDLEWGMLSHNDAKGDARAMPEKTSASFLFDPGAPMEVVSDCIRVNILNIYLGCGALEIQERTTGHHEKVDTTLVQFEEATEEETFVKLGNTNWSGASLKLRWAKD